MRILFVANDFPNALRPTKGPFNMALARALAASHDLRVISPVSWTDRWRYRRRGGDTLSLPLRTIVEGIPVEYPRYYYPPKILRSRYDLFMRWSIAASVRHVLQSFVPDVVLSYWVHPDGAVAARIARKLGIGSAVIVGGSDVLLVTRAAARRRVVSATLSAMDAVLVLSHHLREKTIELGARPQATHLWSQGVDISRFFPGDRQAARQRLGISPAARMLLWVGRMVPVKGLDVFLDAAAELRRRGVAFDAHLIGDGPLRAALEAKTAALGLADRIHFPGSRKPAELPDWYRAADLTLLPSHSEGMPNVLRESLACGTRFVASNVGGISEIAGDAAVNRLVPAGNSQALADALQSVLAGPTPPVTGFTPPSWEQSAAALTAILASISSPRSPIQTGQARSQTDRYFPQSVDVAKQPAVSDAR